MPPADGEHQQKPESVHVGYLGPEASFSHQAALADFPPSTSIVATLHPLPSFTSIFTALQSSSSTKDEDAIPSSSSPLNYALLPVENSTNGSVVQVLDLLSQCSDSVYPDLEVCGEHYLSVHHCLFTSSAPLSSSQSVSNGTQSESIPPRTSSSSPQHHDRYSAVTTIYTHPQVWGQCARFLSAHFGPSVERIDVSSTSAAARLVAQDPSGHSAAISSALAGKVHNLHCLAENIEDDRGSNTTRFFLLRNRSRRDNGLPPLLSFASPTSRSESFAQKQNLKSLITFTIPHAQPGSLADALAVFKARGFNLTTIETRPSRRRNWHYVFIVECEESRVPGHEENLHVMLAELATYTESLRYLGSWVDRLQG